MGIINSIKTFFYGFVVRAKLGFYTRKKRKHKKFARKLIIEKLGRVTLDPKTVDKIAENYLNIGEIFLDRKNLKAVFSVHRLNGRRKNNSTT